MAWVRIDDAAMDHPKILLLSDAQLRLWLRGLCYCQKHLTDGFIPDAALKPLLGKANDVHQLCEVKLWESVTHGFLVHDFLKWNDPRELVQERKDAREEEKVAHRAKMKRWRDAKKRKRDGACDGLHSRHGDSHSDVTVPLLTKPNQTLVQKDPTASSLSAPTSHGHQRGRIFVHPWQLHALIDTLGPHASAFGLDEWVFSLSALADSKGLVLEKNGVWGWVQSEFTSEIRRRGLPIAGAEPSADESLVRMREEIARQDAMVRRA